MIRITDDRAPNGRHLRVQHTYGWERRLLLVDPARGEERLMEIQQHDGLVVEAAGSRQGFAKHQREGEVSRRDREAPGTWVRLPSLPPLYRPPWEGGPAKNPSRVGGAAAKG